jgi:peroxiredoxin family protein
MMEANAPSLNILLVSGDRDRALTALNLAAGALALGRPAALFLTWEAMARFAADSLDQAPLPATVAAPAAAALAGQPGIGASLQTLRTRGLKLYACAGTLQMLGLDAEAVAARVDAVAGAATFLAEAAGGQIVSL